MVPSTYKVGVGLDRVLGAQWAGVTAQSVILTDSFTLRPAHFPICQYIGATRQLQITPDTVRRQQCCPQAKRGGHTSAAVGRGTPSPRHDAEQRSMQEDGRLAAHPHDRQRLSICMRMHSACAPSIGSGRCRTAWWSRRCRGSRRAGSCGCR